MNILYITALIPHLAKGPVYSIPPQIKSQSKLDNVLWYNLIDPFSVKAQLWTYSSLWKKLPYYKDLSDLPQPSLDKLPTPFNKPDLIIFEQFYPFGKYIPFVYKLIKSGIPYIIIPRGELTHHAQQQKKWKKKVANLLFFSYFARKATAIEYLTPQEKQTSGTRWNKTGIVIPNGIVLPQITPKHYMQNQSIKLIYIGRMSIFHKGLDLLLKACEKIKTHLETTKVTIHLYGPDCRNDLEKLKPMPQNLGVQHFVFIHGPIYTNAKVPVLQQADAFIMTSRFEGHPMGLIEALAYGLPCMVTSGTNMREEIEKYNAGWTADNTVASIAAALIKMLKERDQFAQKSANARALATQYDWDKLAQQSHKIYEELLGRNK